MPLPPPKAPPPGVVVTVCATCRTADDPRDAPAGAAFLAACRMTLGGMPGVAVRPANCLSVCKRPCTVAVSDPEGYTFVFGDLALGAGPLALLDFVERYLAAPFGFVPWADRPEALRRGLIARVPPAAWSPDDGETP